MNINEVILVLLTMIGLVWFLNKDAAKQIMEDFFEKKDASL